MPNAPDNQEDIERLYHNILDAISQFSTEISTFKDDTTRQFVLHRETMNRVTQLLSTEFLEFQKRITDQFNATTTRLDIDKDDRDRWRKFATRKDYAVLVSVGCLIVMLTVFSCVVLGAVSYLVYIDVK